MPLPVPPIRVDNANLNARLVIISVRNGLAQRREFSALPLPYRQNAGRKFWTHEANAGQRLRRRHCPTAAVNSNTLLYVWIILSERIRRSVSQTGRTVFSR